jgi:alkylation response protein AidB-like acyl-CoA dehydrogenase
MSLSAVKTRQSDAPPSPTRGDLLARVPELAEKIAVGAAQRDLDRQLPFEAFRLFRESGLGALRIPVELDGPGGSVADYIELIEAIAAADSNVAHALRTHFNFTEQMVLSPDTLKARLGLQRVLEGAIFGGAHTEQGGPKAGITFTTTLTQVGDTYRLNGKKWYATGTAFADYASFSAVGDDGQLTTVLIPVDRAGINVLDDWDGMGQRLTASGGVELTNVEVFADEISTRQLGSLVGRHTSTLRQLHLAACAAGAVRNVLAEATAYVQKQARAAAHSAAATAGEDPFVQATIGRIAANSFAIDAAIAESARALDRTAEAFLANAPESELEALLIASALSTARTQLVLDTLGLKAAELMFETGGGSATSRKYDFDRHWRNIRTLLNHNPLNHKARVVGDYLVNGTTTHLAEGKVF